jgi:hypothetical protein
MSLFLPKENQQRNRKEREITMQFIKECRDKGMKWAFMRIKTFNIQIIEA